MSEPCQHERTAPTSAGSAGDLEALAEALRHSPGWSDSLPEPQRPRASARYLLASDWLAAHTARAVAADQERLARVEAAVQAVVDRMKTRNVDHRHEDEVGYWGAEGRAYFYAGDIYDDYADLLAALAAPHDEHEATP